MKRLLFFLLSIILTLGSACAQGKDVSADNEVGISKLVDRLSRFSDVLPQEKVYLHMDNTSYCLGDTIWFAAYVRSTNAEPAKTSGILYVELLNQDGYMLERQLVEIENGRGHGNITLKREYLYAGYYELRAYTRWQLNWGRYEHHHATVAGQWFINKEKEQEFYRDYDKLYSRVFPVYDEQKDGVFARNMTQRVLRRYFREKQTERSVTLSLYPEGGNLVEGLPCRMAFEAAYDDGEWAEGTLHVNGDSAVTIHRGRGVIELVPEEKESRKAEFVAVTGERVTADLPKVQKTGVTLSVERQADAWLLRIDGTPDLQTNTLALTVMREGRLLHHHLLTESRETVTLPDLALQAGVHQATVFDGEGRVWADRLFFVMGQDLSGPSLTIGETKDEYLPYEKVSLHLSAKERAKGTHVSLAVRDANNQDRTYDTGNLLTEMLLASEIKGFVPQPEWYFEKDDSVHRRGLDLLMMTQGWRRYDWQDMAIQGRWTPDQPKEDNQILVGKVTKDIRLGAAHTDVERDNTQGSGKLKREAVVHAELVIGKQAEQAQTMTENLGEFRMRIPKFYGKGILFLAGQDSTRYKKGKRYEWVLLKPESEDRFEKMKYNRRFRDVDPDPFCITLSHPYPRFVKPYDYYQSILLPSIADKSEDTSMGDFRNRRLQTVFVGARRNGLRAFDPSYPVYMMDAYEAYNDVYDAGFLSTGVDGLARFFVSDMGREFPFIQRIDNSLDRKEIADASPSKRSSNIRKRYGVHPDLIALYDIPLDSVYDPKYLMSFDAEYVDTENFGSRRLNFWEIQDYRDFCNQDRYVIYTDYCPRLEGDKHYMASNMPEVDVALYLFPDRSKRYFYRDRRLILPGLNEPAEYYHPDYSRQTIPSSKDYRRTLYWNPDLLLDANGEARVEFYNNSRTTRISVSADGVTSEGKVVTGSMY